MQVMHLLEKDNPLLATPDGDHYYKSIPAAMWPTLLNLAGEVPLADFTLGGRVVCGDMDAPCLDAHAYDGLVCMSMCMRGSMHVGGCAHT